MIPRTYKLNASGHWIVYNVNPSGKTEWVDYIPVQAVTDVPASTNRYEEDGHIQADTLASVSGLTEWADYTPVYVVTGRADRWRTSADGFIPIVDETP